MTDLTSAATGDAFDRTQRMDLDDLRQEFEGLVNKTFSVSLGSTKFDAQVLRVAHVEALTENGYDHVRVRLQTSIPCYTAVCAMHYAMQGLYDTNDMHRRHGEILSKFDKFNFGRSVEQRVQDNGYVHWIFELEFFK